MQLEYHRHLAAESYCLQLAGSVSCVMIIMFSRPETLAFDERTDALLAL